MTAELGRLALGLALAASLAQAVLLEAATRRGAAAWLAAGRHAADAGAALTALAASCLVAAFVASDAALAAVATHSHASLPVAYRVAAAWSSPEGTPLLWAVALAAWVLARRLAQRNQAPGTGSRALALLGLVQAGFLAVAIATDPFAARGGGAAGPGFDPILQDPAVLLHLPLIALGSTGLAVTFAIAASGLLAARGDPGWARPARSWTLAAWLFLTAGIAAGCLWSDREAGWGGWWSWERLPTAHFIAWLAATALLHLLPAAARGGPLASWTARLALLPLPLAVLGAWLARAGPPAEAFPYPAAGPASGALLALACALAGAALLVLARRPRANAGEAAFEMISLEAALAASTLAILCAMAAVLIGLLHPLASGAREATAGVGPAYFNAVFVTLVMPALALMGIVPRLRWGNEAARDAARDAIQPAAAGLAVVIASAIAVDRLTAAMVAGLFLAGWIAWHGVAALVLRRWGEGNGRPMARSIAMHVAHLGVACVVAGATLAAGLGQSVEVAIAPGASQAAGPLLLRLEGARESDGPNYRAIRLRVVVRDGESEFVLEPQARVYRAAGLPTSEPATHRGIARDVHVGLAGTTGAGSWRLSVRTRPFMSLVWAGMLLVAAGGALALAREVSAARDAAARLPGEAASRLAMGELP